MNLNPPIEPPAPGPARLVTRSELARIAGVSPAAITKACKGSLAPAVVGKLVDLDATCTLYYLAKSGGSPTTVRPSEADLVALRVQHGEVYRVCLPDLEHELVLRTPTRAEIGAYRSKTADGRVLMLWDCVVWPSGSALEALRATCPGRAGADLLVRAIDQIAATPRGQRARRTTRRKRRR